MATDEVDYQYKRPRDDDDEAPPRKEAKGEEKQVYVGNLDFKTDKPFVIEGFSKFGEVKDVYMPLDPRGQARGFCFITFTEPGAAEQACAELNNQEFGGRVIKCNIARPRPAHAQPRQQRPRRPPPARIFVTGLPDDIRERELDDFFYKYGRIEYIEVRRGRRGIEAVVA